MGADLELVVSGRPVRFPAVWLRDNCPCPGCVAAGTGQKLNDITDIPNGLAITRTEDAGEFVLVTFGPDQHRSAFPRSWLEEHALDGDGGDGRTEDDKDLWLPADLDPETGLPATCGWSIRVPHPATWPSPAGRSGRTPTTRTATRRRRSSSCTACAPLARGPETGLVDGFAAAAELRATDAESFGTLTKTPVSFGYVDKETDLRASLPLIQLSPSGRVRGVRFNNRSMRPLRRPYAEVTAFYTAYRQWTELLAQPGRQLNLRLAPGDCLIFDNTRVLHARTAFSMSEGSPGRRLQGCYADLDGLASTLAVLGRSGNHGREESR